jgi:GTP-binding protein LepA
MDYLEEPFILAHDPCPNEFVGGMLALCEEKRGVQREIKYLTPSQGDDYLRMPLNEMVLDFYDASSRSPRGTPP